MLIPINLPKIDEAEVQAVVKVLRSGMLTSGLGAGPQVTEFEKSLQISLVSNMQSQLILAPQLCTLQS
jgi:dTDP-4-amino-4,6-dideoxygalactose transaminase